MISEKAELRLGEESKKSIIADYGLYRNPKVEAYVNEVGHRIVAICERKGIDYDFVVLDTPLVNAFAVPGTVFLTRGILELIDDEAELASVIGHEIGHITGFHAVKLIQKAYGYGFLATFAAVAGTLYAPTLRDTQEYQAYYDTLYRGIGLIAAGFLNGYGRQFELEADRSGLRYAILAGYDPDAMISFFKRMDSLNDEDPAGLSVFFRTHPETPDRVDQVKRMMRSASESGVRDRSFPRTETARRAFQILRSTSARFEDRFERYQEIVGSIEKRVPAAAGVITTHTYRNDAFGFELEAPERWKFELAYGKSLVRLVHEKGRAQGELQAEFLDPDAVLVPGGGGETAGMAAATGAITSGQWSSRVEETLKFRKRTGRNVLYPAGESYVGTYQGLDRTGRPAIYKIFYLVGPARPRAQGVVLSFAAPEESYFDYLVDFDKVMKSLAWRNGD